MLDGIIWGVCMDGQYGARPLISGGQVRPIEFPSQSLRGWVTQIAPTQGLTDYNCNAEQKNCIHMRTLTGLCRYLIPLESCTLLMHVLESTCLNQAASSLLPETLPGCTVIGSGSKCLPTTHSLILQNESRTGLRYTRTEKSSTKDAVPSTLSLMSLTRR